MEGLRGAPVIASNACIELDEGEEEGGLGTSGETHSMAHWLQVA